MSISANQVLRDLEVAQSDKDFRTRSSRLAEQWIAAGAGLDAVDSILRFMEASPELDYGMPGGLVHFAERFHRRGYERLLLESVNRRPTSITTWMLNRLINGTQEAAARSEYLEAMRRASINSVADGDTREQALQFLERLESSSGGRRG